jgi:hypothetical protein
MLNKTKIFTVFFLAFVIFTPVKKSCAVENAALISNYARKLLDIQNWDAMYEKQRKKDINYLIGNIANNSLTNLSTEQKNKIVTMMRGMAIKQLLQDKAYFKGYLINQYSKSFTQDELIKLIEYFKTSLMQMMINARLENTEFTIEEINTKLTSQTVADQNITQWFNGSYLNARYSRFQEDITPKANKMIYERTKDILKAVFNKTSELEKIVSQ